MSTYNRQLSGDGVVQRAKERAAIGFVQIYNTVHPNAPYRFSSASDHLAYSKANILNLAGQNYSKMVITLYPTALNNLVVLPFGFRDGQFIYVDWGDGSKVNSYTSAPSYQYANQATYTVTVTGTADSYGIGYVANPGPDQTAGWYITISIDTWLPTLTSLSGALAWQGTGLVSIPASLPPSVTDLSYLFFQSNATPNNVYAPVTEWDVSNVVNMNCMFYGANLFNQPLATWNVSRVTVMDNMFDYTAINQDLSDWPVVSIQSAQNIFSDPTVGQGFSFLMISEYYPNFNLYNPSLPTVPDPYYSASPATPPAIGDTLRAVVVIPPTDLNITMNLTGSGLLVDWGDGSSSSGSMSYTYANPGTYTVTVTGSATVFSGITNSSSNPVTILSMPSWLNTITDLTDAFQNQPYNFTVPNYLPNSIVIINSMFSGATAFNQPLNSWNTSTVATMNGVFTNAVSFNQPLDTWNTANVTNMGSMFNNAPAFNQPLSTWNTAAVSDMSNMFSGARSFNQLINTWNTSSVTNTVAMFTGATSFNQPLNSWNTAAVTAMNSMFYGANSFNQSLNSWNTAAVGEMSSMFAGATSFNQSLNSWNTAAVTDMRSMFAGATSFNQPLNNWDTSSVTIMTNMFNNATAFNGDVSSWNMTSVTDTQFMFANAVSFNKPMTWTLTVLTNMSYMFYGAVSFNQDLSSWTPQSNILAAKIFGKGAPIATISTHWPAFSNPDPTTYPIYYTGGMQVSITVSTSDITAGSIILKMGFLPAQTVTVDWGDASPTDQWSSAPIHSYASAGTYTVTVTGTANAFNGIVNAVGGIVTITSVTPWLDSLTDLSYLFAGQQQNFTVPTFSGIKPFPPPPPTYLTNFSNMFNGAVAFDGSNLNTWDTSTVTDMSNMFNGTTSLYPDISSWNIGQLVTARSIFANSPAFISDTTTWPNFVSNTNLPDPTIDPEYYTT